MKTRGAFIGAALILALSLASCGTSPTAPPLPTDTPSLVSDTPLPPTRTLSSPTSTALPPTDTPVPPTATPAPIEPPDMGDEVFRSESAGYAIQYPKGWEHTSLADSYSNFFHDSSVAIEDVLSGRALPRVPIVGVTAGPLDEIYEGQLKGAQTAQEVLNILVGWVSEYEGFEQGEPETLTLALAGEEAFGMTVGWSRDGVAVVGRDVVAKRGERVFVIQAVGTAETWDAFLPTLETMLANMAIFEPVVQIQLSEVYDSNVYTIRYPSDWQATSLGGLTVIAKSEEILDEPIPSVPVVLIESGSLNTLAGGVMANAQSAEEMLEAVGQAYLDDNPDIHIGDVEPVSAGGNRGAAVSILWFENGAPAMNLSWALHMGDWGILIQGIGSVDGWASFSDTYGEMVDSLVVLEREEGSVDFSDPASVVQAIFGAARTQEYSLLATLCDPLGEHDGDMDLICSMSTDHPDEESFTEFFANAEVAGEVVIEGSLARVPVLVGPDGDQEETINLVLREGRWYLLGF